MNVGRRLWSVLRERLEPKRAARSLPDVPSLVHDRDAMLYDESKPSIEAYLRADRSAVEAIDRALDSCGRTFEEIRSVLDFGCGHGRVLRQLRPRLPRARVDTCDLDGSAARFCAAEFRAKAIVSNADVTRVRLGRYDLIWVGSVFTHLDRVGIDALLRKLGQALEPSGILCFSVHGEFSASNLTHLYGGHYREEAQAIHREFLDHGIAFRPYEGYTTEPGRAYGMTWLARGYVEGRIDELFRGAVVLRRFDPQGWDGHHDVLAAQAVGTRA